MVNEISFEFTGYLPSGSSIWDHRRGTIQEVLNTLSTLNIRSRQITSWSDDGTNAIVVFCKRK